jgi:hypothetical protein
VNVGEKSVSFNESNKNLVSRPNNNKQYEYKAKCRM